MRSYTQFQRMQRGHNGASAPAGVTQCTLGDLTLPAAMDLWYAMSDSRYHTNAGAWTGNIYQATNFQDRSGNGHDTVDVHQNTNPWPPLFDPDNCITAIGLSNRGESTPLNALDITNAYTLILAVNPFQPGGASSAVVASNCGESGTYVNWSVELSSDTPSLRVRHNTAGTPIATSSHSGNDRIEVLAVVWDGANAWGFDNNATKSAVVSVGAHTLPAGSRIGIGCARNGGAFPNITLDNSRYMNGQCAFWGMSASAMSDANVVANINAIKAGNGITY